jgi:hypothetical protein
MPNFAREYKAEQEGRVMQLGAVALILGPAGWELLTEAGVSSYVEFKLELNIGGGAADFINQKLIQGKSWSAYNIGQTATATAFGGNPLQYAIWGSAGGLFNISKDGYQSGNMFTITPATLNSYKAAFVGNLISGGATKGFERFSGISNPMWASPGSGFILKSVDFTHAVFVAPLANKIEEKLNEKGKE